MRNKVAAAVILGVLAGLVPGAPAVAHHGNCLPGNLDHKQCHRTYKAARQHLGIPKKVILKKIWGHKKRIKSIPIRYKVSKTKKHYKFYGPTIGEQAREATVRAYVDSKTWKLDCGWDPRCVPYPGVTLAKFTHHKTWRWTSLKKCCQVKKKGLTNRYDPDVSALGALQGWDYVGIVDKTGRFEGETFSDTGQTHPKFWHHSTVTPRFKVCLPLWELVCYEDKTPTLHIWGGWGGYSKRKVERD